MHLLNRGLHRAHQGSIRKAHRIVKTIQLAEQLARVNFSFLEPFGALAGVLACCFERRVGQVDGLLNFRQSAGYLFVLSPFIRCSRPLVRGGRVLQRQPGAFLKILLSEGAFQIGLQRASKGQGKNQHGAKVRRSRSKRPPRHMAKQEGSHYFLSPLFAGGVAWSGVA